MITNFKDDAITWDRSSTSFKKLKQIHYTNTHEFMNAESESTPVLMQKAKRPTTNKSVTMPTVVKIGKKPFGTQPI